MHDFEEKPLKESRVWQGRLLDVWQDEVLLPNGKTATREYIRHPGAVVIFATTELGEILIERQFRYPARQSFWELPAGKLEKNEDPLKAAQRELLEETGYASENWQHIGKIHIATGYSDEIIHVFTAQNVKAIANQNLDENEFLSIHLLSPAELFNLIQTNKITDSKTLAALAIVGFFNHLPR